MQGGRSTPLEHLRMAELPRPLIEGSHQQRIIAVDKTRKRGKMILLSVL